MRVLHAIAAALMLVARGVSAEVADAGPGGFLVKHEVTVNAAPDAVYKALIDIGSWWNPSHSYSGNAANLSIDARPGGCFCEKLPNGGGVEHMRIVFVAPGQMLRMSGALGPLQTSGLAGGMTWKLTAGPPATKLELTYSVGGYMQGGADKMAGPVDGVLAEQLRRLKSFVETGAPSAPK